MEPGVRRLFWTFPDGRPGAGLLLLRVATSCALLYDVGTQWPDRLLSVPAALPVVRGLAAIFLFAGAGTPFWGGSIAATQLWQAYVDRDEFMIHGLLVTLGASLALLGGGAWSIDACIFGWQRIDIGGPRRDGDRHPPRA